MSNKAKQTATISARVPGALADALAERASELGVNPSAVVREAVARELLKPARRSSRTAVARLLNDNEEEHV